MSDDELFAAIKRGDRETVLALIRAHPELARARDASGVSPLLASLYYGQAQLLETLRALVPSRDIFEASALGELDLVDALVEGNPSLARMFAPDGFTALGLAAFFGHAEVAELLLARGAEPSVPSRNEMGVTPLHSAVAAGHSRIARALVAAGADIRAKQRHGWTALHAAAEHGDQDLVALFVANGADVLAKNDAGMTAADQARSKGNEAVARYLDAQVRH